VVHMVASVPVYAVFCSAIPISISSAHDTFRWSKHLALFKPSLGEGQTRGN
jgi:cytochrome c oxidase assembly protein Cox11